MRSLAFLLISAVGHCQLIGFRRWPGLSLFPGRARQATRPPMLQAAPRSRRTKPYPVTTPRHADYLIGAGCAARTLRRSFIRAGCTAATGEGQGRPVLERTRSAMAPGGGGVEGDEVEFVRGAGVKVELDGYAGLAGAQGVGEVFVAEHVELEPLLPRRGLIRHQPGRPANVAAVRRVRCASGRPPPLLLGTDRRDEPYVAQAAEHPVQGARRDPCLLGPLPRSGFPQDLMPVHLPPAEHSGHEGPGGRDRRHTITQYGYSCHGSRRSV